MQYCSLLAEVQLVHFKRSEVGLQCIREEAAVTLQEVVMAMSIYSLFSSTEALTSSRALCR
jgi:hypothetical protein